MNKNLVVFFLLGSFFFVPASIARAEVSDKGTMHTQILFRGKQDDEFNEQNELDAEPSESPKPSKPAKHEQVFHGTITAVSGNTFTVNGVVITIDQTKVPHVEQHGTLAVGAWVEANTQLVGTAYYAKEINVKPSRDHGKENEHAPTATATAFGGTAAQLSTQIAQLQQLINLLQELIKNFFSKI